LIFQGLARAGIPNAVASDWTRRSRNATVPRRYAASSRSALALGKPAAQHAARMPKSRLALAFGGENNKIAALTLIRRSGNAQ
jgi:hypothetical protein